MEKEKREQAQILKELEIQALLRGLVKQLDPVVTGTIGASKEFLQWFLARLEALRKLAGEGEMERQLKAIGEEVEKAQEKLRDGAIEEFYSVAQNALRLMRVLFREPG